MSTLSLEATTVSSVLRGNDTFKYSFQTFPLGYYFTSLALSTIASILGLFLFFFFFYCCCKIKYNRTRIHTTHKFLTNNKKNRANCQPSAPELSVISHDEFFTASDLSQIITSDGSSNSESLVYSVTNESLFSDFGSSFNSISISRSLSFISDPLRYIFIKRSPSLNISLLRKIVDLSPTRSITNERF